jgi:hypothetical protein
MLLFITSMLLFIVVIDWEVSIPAIASASSVLVACVALSVFKRFISGRTSSLNHSIALDPSEPPQSLAFISLVK